MTATRPLHTRAAAARGRLLLWCGLVILLLQLFAAVGHAHRGDNDVDTPDCVACSLQAQAQAAPPGTPAPPAAATWSLVQVTAAPEARTPLPVHVRDLLPQPHAPPASRSFS